MAKILIVDDEQDIRNFLALKLEREGFSTIEASDGLEGERRACLTKRISPVQISDAFLEK